MTIRLRRVDALATELKKSATDVKKMLSAKGIVVVDGYYDGGLFDAVFKEPALLGRKRVEWGLSHRLGLGAVKYLMDPLGIRIVVHDCKATQYLMLRRSSKNVYVNWRYANEPTTASCCVFGVRNFLRDNAPNYYLFTCFDGPIGWVVPTKAMVAAWTTLKANGPDDTSIFSIPTGFEEHEGGSLFIQLDLTSSKYELKDHKQLGF
jgi:hypothetical protein